jgi:AraC-like DNA-binding protein
MGLAAAELCDDFGWHPRGRVDSSLVADTAQLSRFGAGNAWSRSARYALTTAPTRMYLVLTMEGGFEFTVDGSPVSTAPGELILLNGEAPTAARSLTDTARYVWYLEPTFLHAGPFRFQHGEPIPTGGGAAVRALTSMTNALLTAPAPVTGAAGRHLALSFENLVAGVLADASRPPQNGTTEHRDGLFMAALAAVEAHFRDPAFTVARLAQEVSVSVRTLHGTFSSMGTTPRREIERRRVTEAHQLSTTRERSAADLAEQSGFTSSRQLSRALSRATTTSA